MDEKIPTCGKRSLVESRAKMLAYLNAVKGEGSAPGDDPVWNSTIWWAMGCDALSAAARGEECPQEMEMCPGGYWPVETEMRGDIYGRYISELICKCA